MIVVFDVNAIWRERPFSALADTGDVLGVIPADFLVARKNADFRSRRESGSMQILPVILPLGWASRTAWLGQRILWNKIKRRVREMGQEIEAVVVTSPHYRTLLDLVPKEVKTIYYASDDYHSYAGWNNMPELEKQVMQRVDHSFFVSSALADRACSEYGMDPRKVSVSMNATDERFFHADGEAVPSDSPTGTYERPIAGVIGGINDRLDFDLLAACADLPELGTLLLVGPLPDNPSAGLQRLLKHPCCVSIGAQPHATIHEWFKCLDVGLIPYTKTELNRYCSPMRLFDHLASGASVVTTDACDQVTEHATQVSVCSDAQTFVEVLKERLSGSGISSAGARHHNITWNERASALAKVIKEVDVG